MMDTATLLAGISALGILGANGFLAKINHKMGHIEAKQDAQKESLNALWGSHNELKKQVLKAVE